MIEKDAAIIRIYDWFQQLRSTLVGDRVERSESYVILDRLLDGIEDNLVLQSIATDSPLLCDTLCRACWSSKGVLPRRETELAERCSLALFSQYTQEIAESSGETIPLSLNYEQYSRVVSDLSYWMVRNEWVTVEGKDVEWRLARKCESLFHVDGISASDLRQLLMRIGILEESQGRIGFASTLLASYYTAMEVLDSYDIHYLARVAHSPDFFQIAVFTAGMASQQNAEKLIEELLARGEEGENSKYLYQLASRCLEEAVQISKELQSMVKMKIEQCDQSDTP